MKEVLRKTIIKRRKNLPFATQQQATEKALELFKDFLSTIPTDKFPKTIGGYYPINGEIDILPLLEWCRTKNIITALPYARRKNTHISFHLFDGDSTKLIKDDFNILSPNPNQKKLLPDIIICPCVAVHRETSERLGYGGGFYDRFAQQHPQTIFVSVIYDFQHIDDMVFEPHDLIIIHKLIIY